MGLVEARSYERFTLLAARASGDLHDLFDGLKDSEAGHHALFARIAYERWPRQEVRDRWNALADAEARIVASIEWGPRIH
jgi:tRNA isopentenyl-2-thiomethyl-A-37 hydroxylase MiaE